MTNYQLGKIYKIVCNTTGLTYYGSTCEPTLARRLAGHVGKYQCWKNNKKGHFCTSSQVLEGKNYDIILVENFPSDNNMELHKRERYYIENNDCVNKKIPLRTDKEYSFDNRERINAYGVQWRVNNKDKVDDYYLNNIDHILDTKAEYRVNNKEKIKEKQSEYRANNKENLSEYYASYYKKNRDKLLANQTEYNLNKRKLKIAGQIAVSNV